MTAKTSLELLEDQYFFINSNRSKLLAACKNQQQRDEVWRSWTIARDNLHEAQNRIFLENDPMLEGLKKELEKTQKEIEKKTNTLQSIAETLKVLTAGVRLASSLIVMGSSFA